MSQDLKGKIGEYVVAGMIVRVKVESVFVEQQTSDREPIIWVEVRPIAGHGSTWVNSRDVMFPNKTD